MISPPQDNAVFSSAASRSGRIADPRHHLPAESASAYDLPALPIKAPLRVLLLMVLSIFVAEIGVMFLLHLWPTLPVLPEAMIDAVALVLVLSPTLYLFHYRPLQHYVQQRNAAIARLSKSEERLQLALHAVDDGLWDWDIPSGEIYYSPRCARMLGFKPDELDPSLEGFLSLVHPEDRERLDQTLSEHLEGYSLDIQIELRLHSRLPDKPWLWIMARGKVVERDDSGRPLRAVGTNTDIDQRKRAEAALKQRKEEIRYLSRQLIKSSESEKKHLAQELHDDFGQMITAVNMGVEMVRTQAGNPEHIDLHCRRLLEISQRMQGSLRELCDNLHPAILDDLGLTRTIEWLANCFEERHPLIHTRVELPDPEQRLGPEVELICYRVCQEALHNIAKHARPTEVEVVLRLEKQQVVLQIYDNGCGFKPETIRSSGHWGIGLLGMRERAAAVGGETVIESADGAGTTVRLTLPRNPQE